MQTKLRAFPSRSEGRQSSKARRSTATPARHAAPSPAGASVPDLQGLLRVALENMNRGISMFGPDQRLLVCNDVYRQVYNLPEHLTRPGVAFGDILDFHVSRSGANADPSASENLTGWIDEHRRRLNCEEGYSRVQVLENGRIIRVTYKALENGGWVDVQEDITEQRRSEETISWLAHHDALTEIPNRLMFDKNLSYAMSQADDGAAFALLLIDLDRFKSVNDTFGHPVGDELLQQVAGRLQHSVRDSDFVARLGGDEFAVIETGAKTVSDAAPVARRIIAEISRGFSIQGETVDIGASVGIAFAPSQALDQESLYKFADKALFRAKTNGRGNFAIFDRLLDGRAAA